MDMSMAVPSSPTATAGMAMPSSGDSSTPGMTMGMDQMAMTFFTGTTTALFSSSWKPATTGQYAGTCIFLIAFAIIFRALLAARLNIIAVMAAVKHRHSGCYLADMKSSARRPWRADEAVMLASMDVVLAGVGYLLWVLIQFVELCSC
jgi:copper transporter 1